MQYYVRLLGGFALFLLIAPWASAQGKEPLPGALARIGTTHYQVSRHRNAQLLSPDGKLLAVSMPSEGIYLWRLPAWTLHHCIQVDRIDPDVNARFDCFVFTPNGKKLLIFNANTDQILVYDIAAGKVAKRIPLPVDGPFAEAALMPVQDQQSFVFTWEDGNILKQRFLVFDLDQGLFKHFLKLEYDRQAHGPQFALAPDGRVVRQQTQAFKRIEVWDPASGKAAKTFDTSNTLKKLLVSPNGKTLLALDEGSTARNFDLEAGAERPHPLDITGAPVAFSPDSKSFYLAQEDGTLHRHKTADNTLLATHVAPVRCTISQIAFGADRKALALGMSRTTLFLWEVETGKLLSPAEVPSGAVIELAFTPQDDLFIAAENGHAAWWQPRSGVKLRDLKLAHAGPVRLDGRPLTLADRGDIVAFGVSPVGFFDATTGRTLYDKKPVGQPVFRYFENGKKVAWLEANRIVTCDARSGDEISRVELPFVPIQAEKRKMAIAADARFIAFTGTGSVIDPKRHRILVADVLQKKVLDERLLEGTQEGLAFSPNGHWLAVNDGKERLLLWRVGSKRGDSYKELRQRAWDFTALAFAPDGRQLAYAVVDPFASPLVNRIHIYEMSSKKVRLELPGHPEGAIERLAYAPGSGMLASAATDGMVYVWQAGLPRFAEKPERKPAAKDLDASFHEMAGNDAQAAFRAMLKLAQTPTHTATLFAQKIAVSPKLDLEGRTLAQWITDLGSKTFSVRSKANAILQRVGPDAENDLRAALQRGPDLETKRRIEDLLDRLAAAEEPTPQDILHARAVEVLEAIATPEARALLTRWSEGDAEAVLTAEARRTLARLSGVKKADK